MSSDYLFIQLRLDVNDRIFCLTRCLFTVVGAHIMVKHVYASVLHSLFMGPR